MEEIESRKCDEGQRRENAAEGEWVVVLMMAVFLCCGNDAYCLLMNHAQRGLGRRCCWRRCFWSIECKSSGRRNRRRCGSAEDVEQDDGR
jgi:hypothetical protein